MIEQGSKVFSCFLDVRKAFDTIWIDGLLYKLYHELGINSNNKKRSHTQLDSRKQVIAFQDRVITINIKEAQHPLK